MKQTHAITLNSVILYVIAFLLTTFIYELAHAIAGRVCDSEPVLLPGTTF